MLNLGRHRINTHTYVVDIVWENTTGNQVKTAKSKQNILAANGGELFFVLGETDLTQLHVRPLMTW